MIKPKIQGELSKMRLATGVFFRRRVDRRVMRVVFDVFLSLGRSSMKKRSKLKDVLPLVSLKIVDTISSSSFLTRTGRADGSSSGRRSRCGCSGAGGSRSRSNSGLWAMSC